MQEQYLVEHNRPNKDRNTHQFIIDVDFTEEQAKALACVLWFVMKKRATKINAPMKLNKTCKVSYAPTLGNQIVITFTFTHKFFWIGYIKAFNKQINKTVLKALASANINEYADKLGNKVARTIKKHIQAIKHRDEWKRYISILDNLRLQCIKVAPAEFNHLATKNMVLGGLNA